MSFFTFLIPRKKKGPLSAKLEANLRLSDIAQPITPVTHWDELVLPDEERQVLLHLVEYVKNRYRRYERFGFFAKLVRNKGTCILLEGDRERDRSMVVEVLANDLKLGLYRVDCSAVVNKYIGETEKNLNMLLDLAAQGRVILWFDEADALFGKRSEVNDTHDRNANIEVSNLLNRMERINGLVILATNLKAELEADCIQKMKYVVKLPIQDSEKRKKRNATL